MSLLAVIAAEIILGMIIFLFASAGHVVEDDWVVLAGTCFVGLALCFAAIAALLRRDRQCVLYDAFFYLNLASVAYYFFGPLIYVFGPEQARAYATSEYPITASDAVWITGLQMVAIGITGAAYALARFHRAYEWTLAISKSYARLPVAGILLPLLVISLVIQFALILPQEFTSPEDIAPTVFRVIQQFLMIALYMLFALASDEQRRWLPWALLLLTVEVGTGVLQFNKSTIIGCALFAGLGWFGRRTSWKPLMIGGLLLVALFEFSMPMVSYGRERLVEGSVLGGSFGERVQIASFGERTEIIRSYLEEASISEYAGASAGMSWVRLNYLPVQKAAIDLYNNGRGGDDLELIGWLVVPRILYPDKPIVTKSGQALYEKITGEQSSNVSAGLFLDAYYNVGLVGVFVIPVILGFSLAFYTAIGRGIIRGGAHLLYPLVAFGIYRGIRVDGTILADVAAPLVIFVAMLGAVAALRLGHLRIT